MNFEDKESSACADIQEEQPTEVITESEKTPAFNPNTQIEEKLEVEKTSDISNIEERIDTPTPEDKALYEEILEKLDIKQREKIEEPQQQKAEGSLKQEAYLNHVQKLKESQVKMQLEKVLSQDFAKIQKLLQAGLVNSEQGQNLKKQVLKKAFDKLVQSEKTKRNLSAELMKQQPQPKNVDKSKVFEEFSKDNPDFFNPSGRKEVLDYLKSDGISVGKDELGKISEIIRVVEKSAIDRYLQKIAHEKTLKNSNETAKQRLTANAQKSGRGGGFSKTFTREQIGKMSSAEFTKYEPFIMEQLKKGFIK